MGLHPPLSGTNCTISFYKNISRTSAVSSKNFRSIFIFASCVVGTCNIGEFSLGGVLFIVHYNCKDRWVWLNMVEHCSHKMRIQDWI